jgi:hypothetical protein
MVLFLLEIKSIPSSPLPAMAVQTTGGSIPRSISMQVSMIALKPKLFSMGSGLLGFLRTPIRVSMLRGNLGHQKKKGVGLGAVAKDDLRKDALFDDQIQVLPSQLFLNAKDLIEDTGIFRVGFLETESQNLHLGSGDFGINGESAGVTFRFDADLFMKGLLIGMVQPVADPPSNIFDNDDKLYAVAFLLEPVASLFAKCGSVTYCNYKVRIFKKGYFPTFFKIINIQKESRYIRHFGVSLSQALNAKPVDK